MKRRGFIALVAGGLVYWFHEVAHAVCNPSLVRLFAKGRQLVQSRAGRAPALGDYFIEWYGHSSFLIHSGSQSRCRSQFQCYPRYPSRCGDGQQRSFHPQQYRRSHGEPRYSSGHYLSPDLESYSHQRKRYHDRQYTEPARRRVGRRRELNFCL